MVQHAHEGEVLNTHEDHAIELNVCADGVLDVERSGNIADYECIGDYHNGPQNSTLRIDITDDTEEAD